MGSRWVPGGSVVNWPLYRQAISRIGSTYARIMLGVKIKDVTGGYRAFRRSTLEALNLDEVESVGYGFQVDLAWRVAKLGLRIEERPITFVERELGASKMSGNIVVEAMINVTKWGTGSTLGKTHAQVARSGKVARTFPSTKAGSVPKRNRTRPLSLKQQPMLCGAALSTALTQDVQTVLEDLLKLGKAAAFQEHVPVGADGFLVGVHRSLAINQQRFLAGLGNPYGGEFRLRRRRSRRPARHPRNGTRPAGAVPVQRRILFPCFGRQDAYPPAGCDRS